MPPTIKLNSDSLKSLSANGINPKTIELIEGARRVGAIFKSRADLERIGLSKDEVQAIIPLVSLAEPAPVQDIKTAFIETDLKGSPEYVLVVRYFNKNTQQFVESSYPVSPLDKTEIKYDDKAVTGKFLLAIKAPSGEFAEIEFGGKKGVFAEADKSGLSSAKLKVTRPIPVKTVTGKKVSVSRVKGRLLCNNPSRKIEKVHIVIDVAFTKDAAGKPVFIPVAYAVTEQAGYFFSSELQFENEGDGSKILQARAKIGFRNVPEVDIHLEKIDPQTKLGQLPQKLILYIEDDVIQDAGDGSEDCSCEQLDFHDKKVLDEFSFYSVVRTTEPLIEALSIEDEREIDLGDLVDDSGLGDLLKGIKLPPIVARDFILRRGAITKDNYKSLLAQATASNQIQKTKGNPSEQPVVRKQMAGRISLNGSNVIDWDEKPTIYQATSIAHGHILQFKQEWFSDGYSLGDLLYSLPLAPGQKKQIVVFDWDRRDSAARTEQLDYQEKLYNSLSRDRDIKEIVDATIKEHLEGESSATTMGAAGGVGAIIPGAPVLVGGGAGIGHSFSSASQDSKRSTTASSRQHIKDRTTQAANAIRSQRATVIQTASQGERFQVSSEVVANYNHCHALTIQYFEILRHFEVRLRLASVQECLFIPLQITPFDIAKALRWRDILTRCLRRRSLVAGFASLARYHDAVDKCGLDDKACIDKHYDELDIPNKWFAEEELEYLEGELYIEFNIRRPANDDKDEFDEARWAYYSPFIGNPREFYDSYLRRERKKDEAFARHIGPTIVREMLSRVEFYAVKNGMQGERLPVDLTLLSDFRNKTKLNISVRMDDTIPPIKRENIDFIDIVINEPSEEKKELLRNLLNENVRITVHSGSMRYRTRNLHEHLFKSATIKNDLTFDGDHVRIFTPLSSKAQRKPRLEDVELINNLLHHLNENLEYYHQWIWAKMDPQRRFMLLDGLVAPGKANGRSVASVVENRLVGIAGNCIIMPVAPGFQLDPTLDSGIDLFEHYYEDPKDPIHLALPTKGVFAEAVMGKCNSCEKKDESRFWRWEEAPIPDSPTAINPVALPVPQNVQPANLQAKDFPAPIINLQNGPALPDPQGFGSLVQLLSNPNIFKDITGLTDNQKNALASLQAAFSTAQSFGNQAASLAPLFAKQQALDQIRKAKENGLLNEEQAQALTRDAISSILGNTGSSVSQATEDLKRVKENVDKGAITPEKGEELEDVIIDFENAKVESVKADNRNKINSEPKTSSDLQLFVVFRNVDGRILFAEDLFGFDAEFVFEGASDSGGAPLQFSGHHYGALIQNFKLSAGDIEIYLADSGGIAFSGRESFTITRTTTALSIDATMEKKTIPVIFNTSVAVSETINKSLSGELGGKMSRSGQLTIAKIIQATIGNEVNAKLAAAGSSTTGNVTTTGVNVTIPVDIPTGNLKLKITPQSP